jgi:hypothetical protein
MPQLDVLILFEELFLAAIIICLVFFIVIWFILGVFNIVYLRVKVGRFVIKFSEESFFFFFNIKFSYNNPVIINKLVRDEK